MTGQALGLIEAVGLPAAIAAADAAVKAANVKLLGYELTKGGGLVIIKLEGDVGAIKAAVDAGASEAKGVHGVWAVHVIPRPAGDTDKLVLADLNITPGGENSQQAEAAVQNSVVEEKPIEEKPIEEKPIEEKPIEEKPEPPETGSKKSKPNNKK